MKSGNRKPRPIPKGRTWAVTGACVRGASHIKNDLPCQDALRIENIGAYRIIALSDGHGSASCPYSDEGSQAAVDAVYAIFGSIIMGKGDPYHTIAANKDIWLPKQIEQHWKSAVQTIHQNKEQGLNMPDFSHELYGATLLTLIAAEDFIFALQLGDGDILSIQIADGAGEADGADGANQADEAQQNNLQVDWVLPPSDTLGPETNSLCQEDCWQYMKTRIIPLAAGEKAPMFFLSTDGYANSFSNDEGFKKAGADFYELWNNKGLMYIKDNLESWLIESSVQGSGDDITAALVLGE